jgi:predicted DsbA family dithiol-disulfide isomerase
MKRAIVVVLLLLSATLALHAQLDAPTRGPQDARSQLEVFLAFGDEASGHLAVVLDALAERHPADVRLVFRHVTPENDPAAALPHHAALAAQRQAQFWKMAQLLFANQDRHTREDLIGMAHQLGLDLARFIADLDDGSAEVVWRADRDRAAEAGITGAGAVLIDGIRYTGELTLQRIEASLNR